MGKKVKRFVLIVLLCIIAAVTAGIYVYNIELGYTTDRRISLWFALAAMFISFFCCTFVWAVIHAFSTKRAPRTRALRS